MKTLVKTKAETEYVAIDEVDFLKSFIAFRKRDKTKDIGYLILSVTDQIIRAVACDGSIDNHYPYYSGSSEVKNAVNKLMEAFDVFVFNSQKEFFSMVS